MNRILKAVCFAVAVSLSLAACSGGQVRSPDGSDSNFVIAPTVAVVTDLDPAISYTNEVLALQNVYESLTRYNSQTERAEPLLAKSWTVSSDALTWTFTLREGVKFHSGRALGATAVKESLDRNRGAGAGGSYIWGAVTDIAATDANTITITLSYPAPIDLIASAAFSAYIYDVYAAGSNDLNAWFNSGKDSGSGPYTIVNWEKGAEVEMKLGSFSDYWGGWSGGHFKSIEYRVTPDANTAWQLLQNGEIDYRQFLTPQLFVKAKTTPSVQTSDTPTFQNIVSMFNTAAGPTAELNVRKALQLAIDYKGLVASLDGAVTTSSGIIPEGLLGYTAGLEGATDLKKAAELLKSSGYGSGGKKLELTLTYAQGDVAQEKLVTLLTSAIQQLGGTLTATPMDFPAQWDLAKSEDPTQRQNIFLLYWFPEYADSYSWFVNLFHTEETIAFNLSYVSDPSLDTVIDSLPQLTSTDPAKAQETYAALQKTILDDDALAAFPAVQRAQRVLSDRVSGFVDNPAYPNVVRVYDLKVVR